MFAAREKAVFPENVQYCRILASLLFEIFSSRNFGPEIAAQHEINMLSG
jgi:hypothetical protein